jgi:hypothetical protein
VTVKIEGAEAWLIYLSHSRCEIFKMPYILKDDAKTNNET